MTRRGVLAPLFDRIASSSEGEERPAAFLDAEGVRASILREVSLMMNTRCMVRRVEYNNYAQNILIYGMPDFLGLPDLNEENPTDPQSWPAIARTIERTIRAVEPRILSIRVKVLRFDGVQQELVVDIQAQAAAAKEVLDISFPLAISKR